MGRTSEREWIAVPGKGYRVARCTRCDLGFTWKHADQIGCPDCGTDTLTTSTRQRRAGFFIVEGAELVAARIVGLAGTIKWHRRRADSMFVRAGRVMSEDGWQVSKFDGCMENDGRLERWPGILDAASKELDKAVKVARKRDRLIEKGA